MAALEAPMTHTAYRRPDRRHESETTRPRDIALSLTGGNVLIYDRGHPQAWILSNAALSLVDAA